MTREPVLSVKTFAIAHRGATVGVHSRRVMFAEYLPLLMFAVLMLLVFSSYPLVLFWEVCGSIRIFGGLQAFSR
ncbi:MAG: hypothetical protein Ct9H300mP16_02990 [Pseudomonadota bacterium]|nr:MAG: hypothetical protein Ct9H300mP16_02990 [Pseudomonadota bacterium]